MRLHINSKSGFILLSYQLEGTGRRSGHVYYPSTNSSSTGEGSCGHVLVRSHLVSKLVECGLSKKNAIASRLQSSSPHQKKSLKVAFLACITAWAATLSSPSELFSPTTTLKTPSYAGYDFSVPFKMDTFFSKKVKESIPFAKAQALQIPELPEFAFLKMPSSVSEGEGTYLVSAVDWADSLDLSEKGLTRRRLTPFGNCGASKIYATEASAAILLPSKTPNISVVLLSPPDLSIVCTRAKVVSENAL